MDAMVQKTQQWLNLTYANDSRYIHITEDGSTGWNTIYALTRALQIELGIQTTANNFGPTSRQLFNQRWPNGISPTSSTSNVYGIIQGALWCKGYDTNSYDITTTFTVGTGLAVQSLKTDAGVNANSPAVTLNVMLALLSMIQFKLLSSYGGTQEIRDMQKDLNSRYESYIGIIPCDGLYGREMNKALIIVLQAVEGFSVSACDGIFGTNTKNNCPLLPDTNNLLSDAKEIEATKLFRYALTCNDYSVSVALEYWSEAVEASVKEFQIAYGLPETGKADIDTWMALLLSSGNKSRSAAACDCATILDNAKAVSLYNAGYRHIGRYLTGTVGSNYQSKALTTSELIAIHNAGLSVFAIYQDNSSSASYYTHAQGQSDAQKAYDAAYNLGIPYSETIYFTVDYDAIDVEVTSNVIPYFQGINEIIDSYPHTYKVGIYGPRNVCTRVSGAGYSETCFVSDMSTGYSGNMGYKIPTNWAFDQFSEITFSSTNGSFGLDKDAYSGLYAGFNHLEEHDIFDETYVQPTKPEDASSYLFILNDTFMSNWGALEEACYDQYVFEYGDNPIYSVLALQILNYLRSQEYNSITWLGATGWPAAGTLTTYIEQNYPTLHNYFLPFFRKEENGVTRQLLYAGYDGLLDLAHWAATTMVYTSISSPAPDYWAGWGGDVATGTKVVSTLHAILPDMDIKLLADATIGAQDDNDLFGTGEHSSCNYTDICSDADAIGIAKILKDNQVNKSTRAEVAHFLSDTLKQYYTGAVEHRFSNYLNDLGALTTLDDLHTTISNLMLNPELLSVMSLLGNTSNAEIGKAVFLSWAKYLWTELK